MADLSTLLNQHSFQGDEELDLEKDDKLRVFKRYNHWSYAVKEEGGDRGWVPVRSLVRVWFLLLTSFHLKVVVHWQSRVWTDRRRSHHCIVIGRPGFADEQRVSCDWARDIDGQDLNMVSSVFMFMIYAFMSLCYHCTLQSPIRLFF